MSSNTRIKDLRQTLGLSQEEFGKKIACSRDVINNYERQRANVPPPTELAIASAYNVNIEWLRTGEGPMFVETKDDYIEHLVQLYKGGDILRKVINAFIALAPEEQKAVLKFVDNLSPEPEEKVLKIARSSDDHSPETAKIPKSEIRAALSERAKSDDDLK